MHGDSCQHWPQVTDQGAKRSWPDTHLGHSQRVPHAAPPAPGFQRHPHAAGAVNSALLARACSLLSTPHVAVSGYPVETSTRNMGRILSLPQKYILLSIPQTRSNRPHTHAACRAQAVPSQGCDCERPPALHAAKAVASNTEALPQQPASTPQPWLLAPPLHSEGQGPSPAGFHAAHLPLKPVLSIELQAVH